MKYYEITQMERKKTLQMLEIYREKCGQYPEKKLYIRKIDGQERYYCIVQGDKKQHYIGWKQAELLRGLIEKKNAEEKIPLLEKNLKLLDKVLESYHSDSEIFPIDSLPQAAGAKRKSYPLSENTHFSKYYRHDTGLGFYCSSKSEAIIARRYHTLGIPFQYEKRIRVKGTDGIWKNMYPDFTIFGAEKVYYHEHFGMFEKEDYREDNMQRLADYHANHILMGRDLFITMDDPKGGLDVGAVDQFIINTILPLCYKVQ